MIQCNKCKIPTQQRRDVTRSFQLKSAIANEKASIKARQSE